MTAPPVPDRHDLTTLSGRIGAYVNLVWTDHGWLRFGFQNAHWLNRAPGQEMVRTNQPWPFQVKWWARRGIKTIINLRGSNGMGLHLLEKEACRRNGVAMYDVAVYSRAVPTRAEVEAAKAMFESIEYPAMMHCKSGSDRAGLMSVLYMHFHEGRSIREAKEELSLRYGHMSAGMTGVLDYAFDRYLAEGEPAGLTFLQWVQRPEYDPDQIKADFKSTWWGRFWTEGILRRE